jgi:hypothetical protein
MENNNSIKEISKIFQCMYSKSPIGDCKNSDFEFGNMHRTNISCAFHIDGKCYFNGDCDRRHTNYSGWNTN